MIGAAIIVFREIIEAGLIVGIVLAVTRGVAGRGLWISGGVLAGVVGAGLVALFAGAISNALAGMGQEIFNAAVLIVAVLMLSWHNIWMARHGREMAAELKAVGEEVARGSKSLFALAVVVAVAVLREGSEIVLFLYGIAAAGGDSGLSMLGGGLLGLAAGATVSALTYFGLVKIPPRFLFGVTSLLIAFLAAGMAAQAVAFLQQAGVLDALSATVWDTSGWLKDSSMAGRVLHTLFGYTDQPSGMQLAVYIATLAAIFGLGRLLAPPPRPVMRSAVAG